MEALFFTNPNPEKGLVGTPVLNRFSKILRVSNVEIKEEGFNICPFDFVWEYEVQFKSGHIVFREVGNDTLKAWVYQDGKDLNPKIFMLENTDLDLDGEVFVGVVRQMKSLITPFKKASNGGSNNIPKKKKRK
jgi:hypothetical protein